MISVQHFHIITDDDQEFPILDLQRKLDTNPCAIRHPKYNEPVYVICGNYVHASLRAEDFRQDPDCAFDTNGMVSLEKDMITVYLPGSKEIHGQIRDLLLPIFQQYRCKIRDDFGNDLTDKHRDNWKSIFSL
jgi:hypothetical protein